MIKSINHPSLTKWFRAIYAAPNLAKRVRALADAVCEVKRVETKPKLETIVAKESTN